MVPKLIDGDYAVDIRGNLLVAVGDEELLERAAIRLRAKKGCFPLDPALGSELWHADLSRADTDDIAAAVYEALAPLPELEPLGVEKSADIQNGRLTLLIRLRVNGHEKMLALAGKETE